jgi:predicted SAM-dependent methyltransferase
MKILDLACGKRKFKNENAVVIGLDKVKLPGVDIIWNLEKTPLPFSDNEFDIVYARHILEHIRNFFSLMEELHRITKKDGKIIVRVPHFSNQYAFVCPDHKRFFALNSFDYFTPNNRENYYSKARFKIIKKRLIFINIDSKWAFLNVLFNPVINIWQNFTEKFPILSPEEIYFELRPIKEDKKCR